MNKSKLKKGMTAALAAALIAAQAMPAFAVNYRTNTGSTEIITEHDQYGEYKWASGKKNEYPGWYWVDQYCYYYTIPRTYLKNTTTPDGYTVDELGRWTVNGVPQTNNYGKEYFNTDTLYAEKTDDERWEIMRGLLEKEYANMYGDKMTVAMASSLENWVQGQLMTGSGFGMMFSVQHNTTGTSTDSPHYIKAMFTSAWSDSVLQSLTVGSAADTSRIYEKTLKIILGDHVGQELFDQIRKVAEPHGGPIVDTAIDGNGNLIFDEDEFGRKNGRVAQITIPESGDGINWSLFDFSKWKNRTTDYGKSFSLSLDEYNTPVINIG